MDTIKNIIDIILKWLTIIIFSLATILVIYQVFTRYALHSPSSWSESAITYGFIWFVLLCSAYVFGQREHMNMSFIRDKFSKKVQIIIEFICEIFIEFLAIVAFIIGGYNMSVSQMMQIDPSLKIPVGIIYAVVPISGICMLFYCIYNQYMLIKEFKNQKNI